MSISHDEERFAKLRRDTLAAGTQPIEIHITAWPDRTMQISGPSGDKELFLLLLEQAKDAVRANAKSRGSLIVPGSNGEAVPRPEGYF